MKKTFLSFLFGAIIIASTSVFVSCQDYQDEFSDLQEQIDDNNSTLSGQIASLESQLAALKTQHAKDVELLAQSDKELNDLIDKLAKQEANDVITLTQNLAQAKADIEKAMAEGDEKAMAAAKQAAADAQAALEQAMKYADQVAAAQAQKEAAAALKSANEASQKLYEDAIRQLKEVQENIIALHDKDIKAEQDARKAADDALTVAYTQADTDLKNLINSLIDGANADIKRANEEIKKAQELAQKAYDLAEKNSTAIADEAKRAKEAEEKAQTAAEAAQAAADKAQKTGDAAAQAAADAAKAAADEKLRAQKAESEIWDAIDANTQAIAKNAKDIKTNYADLKGKIQDAVSRIEKLEKGLEKVQNDLAIAQDSLKAHTAQLIALRASVSSLEGDVTTLQGEMATANENIETLFANLSQEVADREDADEDLQDQITKNLGLLKAEILRSTTRDNVLSDSIKANKADIDTLFNRVSKLNIELAQEIADREEADEALLDSIASVAEDLAALSNKVEGYYTELKGRIEVLESQLSNLFANDFAIITDVKLFYVEGPSVDFEYYNGFDTIAFPVQNEESLLEVESGKFAGTLSIVDGSFEVTDGYAVYLLNPTTESHVGQKMHWIDEKGAHHPYFTLGEAFVDTTDADYYYKRNFGGMRAENTDPDEFNKPLYRSAMSLAEVDTAMFLSVLKPEQGETIRISGDNDKSSAMLPVMTEQLFALVAQYKAFNENADTINEYCYGDFEFEGRPVKVNYGVSELGEIEFDATPNDTVPMCIKLDVTGDDDPAVYKEFLACVGAWDACGEAEDDAQLEAIDYVNGLCKDLNAVKDGPSAFADPTYLTISKDYMFWSFAFEYQVLDKNGNITVLNDTVIVTPAIEKATKTFEFTGTPTSAATQFTEAQAIDSFLVWNEKLPKCSEVEATFELVQGNVANSGIFTFGITPGYGDNTYYWDAFNAGKSDSYDFDATEGLKEVFIAYNPALVSLYQTYEWKVTVKFGETVISESTIIFNEERPAGHDIELIPITSAWNKAKTETIVWAQGYEGATEDALSDAWYKLQGSYTNILNYLEPIDSCGCTLAFVDSTDYADAAEFEVVTMPESANTFQLDVPAEAVQANTGYKELSFTVLEESGWWYDLAYGTNVFGLDSLFGGVHEFAIAYCSPIYYDGVTYNWEKQVYEGGCKLKKENYYIEFPRQETLINEADFIGSNDPSTSVVDPIKYFGEDRDYRILNIEVELGDAEEIKGEYPDYYVWNDPTNEYLFETLPTITEDGIYFKTYNEQPSLQSIPAFYYNFTVTDIWGCKKTYPFVISVNPNTPMN